LENNFVNSVTGFSVLLDRAGPGPYGYGDAGMNVTLTSVSTFGMPQGNIDSYGGAFIPGGVWNPDPAANLGSFTSQNGTWTLFIADLSTPSGLAICQKPGIRIARQADCIWFQQFCLTVSDR
jgi:hypothetical protein